MYKSKTKRGILLKVSFERKSIKNVHRPLSANVVVFSPHLSFRETFWVLISPVTKSARHRRMKTIERKTHQTRERKEKLEKNRSSHLPRSSSFDADDSFI